MREHRPRLASPGMAVRVWYVFVADENQPVRGAGAVNEPPGLRRESARVMATPSRTAVGVIGAGVKAPAGETVAELWQNLLGSRAWHRPRSGMSTLMGPPRCSTTVPRPAP